MALTQTNVVDKIEILEDGTLQVREALRVFDDLGLVGERYKRYVLTPDTTLNTITNNRVRALANFVWTPATIAAYLAAKAATTLPGA